MANPISNFLKRKYVIGAIILIGIGFFAFIFYGTKDESAVNYDELSELDQMVYRIVTDDYAYFNSIDLDVNKLPELEDRISNTTNDDILTRLYFVMGVMREVKLMDYEAAYNDFLAATEHFTNNTSIKLKACIYTYISNVLVELDKPDASATAFAKVTSLYQGKGSRTIKYKTYIDCIINRVCSQYTYNIENHVTDFQPLIDLLNTALEISLQHGDYHLFEIYYLLGQTYYGNNQATQGTNYKLQALKIAEENNNAEELIVVSIDLGLDYQDRAVYTEAAKYFENALELMSDPELGITEFDRTYCDINLAQSQIESGALDTVRRRLDSLEKQLRNVQLGNELYPHKIYADYLYAKFYSLANEVTQAHAYANQAKQEFQGLTGNNGELMIYPNFSILLQMLEGDILYQEQRYDMALKYHLAVFEFAQENNLASIESQSNEALYKDYIGLGDYKQATEHTLMAINNYEDYTVAQQRQYSEYVFNKYEHSKNITTSPSDSRLFSVTTIIVVMLFVAVLSILAWLYSINRKLTSSLQNLETDVAKDPLTGLANRRGLDEYFEELTSTRDPQEYGPLGVCIMDVDFFKQYNDEYGHPAGDKVLKTVASCLKEASKLFPGTLVCRYGGEEFTAVVQNATGKNMSRFAEKLQSLLTEANIPHKKSQVAQRVTISIGIVVTDPGVKLAYPQYLHFADEVLYKSKERRNCFTIDETRLNDPSFLQAQLQQVKVENEVVERIREERRTYEQ